MVADKEKDYEELLEYLRANRGFDFTGYKRASLIRRISKRMTDIQVQSVPDYVDYLEVHPDEFGLLFNTILINVTSFFRDTPAWEYVASDIIPSIAESSGDRQIRVWSAGCASGEEAYSLAILLAEHFGPDEMRRRVKIYATDVDDEALLAARQAAYTSRALEPVKEEWREKYFEQVGARFVFRADLRRSIIFGRHDLVQDAPISRLDLLVCRNVLMYLNAETQAKVVSNLHFAVKDTGYLFLGHAEMLLSHSEIFRPVDLKYRVFQPAVGPVRDLRVGDGDDKADRGAAPSQDERMHAAFDAGGSPMVVIDPSGKLVVANEPARRQFGVSLADVGRAFSELELSYRPVELRSRLDDILLNRHPIELADVERPLPDGGVQYLHVRVTPLGDADGGFLGTLIRFDDVSALRRLQADFVRSNQELETAYEELQSTNEELETTNEELQSTVEELETTNEELQSTNEELETMNEELQSTNAEMHTVNDEFQRTTAENKSVSAFLGSVLTSLQVGLAVVDGNFNVTAWNKKAQELWGLREDEVRGLSLVKLDIGLPIGDVVKAARACLSGSSLQEQLTVEAVDRRGRSIVCRVTCSPLISSDDMIHGIVITMEQEETSGQA
jgi:two-component system, chemotaxis family, CheB/CheR fusion protein